ANSIAAAFEGLTDKVLRPRDCIPGIARLSKRLTLANHLWGHSSKASIRYPLYSTALALTHAKWARKPERDRLTNAAHAAWFGESEERGHLSSVRLACRHGRMSTDRERPRPKIVPRRQVTVRKERIPRSGARLAAACRANGVD